MKYCYSMDYRPHAHSTRGATASDSDQDGRKAKGDQKKEKSKREDTLTFKPWKAHQTVFTKMEGKQHAGNLLVLLVFQYVMQIYHLFFCFCS